MNISKVQFQTQTAFLIGDGITIIRVVRLDTLIGEAGAPFYGTVYGNRRYMKIVVEAFAPPAIQSAEEEAAGNALLEHLNKRRRQTHYD